MRSTHSRSPIGGASDAGAFVVAAFAVVLVAPSIGCDGGRATATADGSPLRFLITNHLVAPVEVSVDGVPAIGLKGGASAGIAVPSTAQSLSWTSAKPTDAEGHPIADDLGEVKVAVGGIGLTLDIDNVIGDTTYITARIFNHTSAAVSIGFQNGTVTSCAAALPASTATATYFTQTGYYRLLPTTEIRAFRDPTSCSGPWVAWEPAELRAFTARSGALVLSLDRAP